MEVRSTFSRLHLRPWVLRQMVQVEAEAVLVERKVELLEESGVQRKGLVEQGRSVDWNASFANRTWSILQAAAYQASESVSAGCLKGMVAI